MSLFQSCMRCVIRHNVGSVVRADVLVLLHKKVCKSFGEGAVHMTGNKKKTKQARSYTTQIHTTVGLRVKPRHCLAVAIVLPHPFLVSFMFYLPSFRWLFTSTSTGGCCTSLHDRQLFLEQQLDTSVL